MKKNESFTFLMCGATSKTMMNCIGFKPETGNYKKCKFQCYISPTNYYFCENEELKYLLEEELREEGREEVRNNLL